MDKCRAARVRTAKLPTMVNAKRRIARLVCSERGDVPGWVLITLMTAALVAGIWALAGPALGTLFENAISRVSGF